MQRIIERYYSPLLLLLVAFTFFTRLYRVHIPENYMFDEVYHAVTAKLIAHNDPRAYEWSARSDEPDTAIDWLHPPGAKLLQAGSIRLFGETSFAWRLSSVVFGTLVVLTTAWLAQALFQDKRLALLAGFFAACDGLLLVQSRIAMNDIHVTFFILQSLLWYWKYRKEKIYRYFLATAVMAGFAIASKWSGVFVIGAIGVFEVLSLEIKQWKATNSWKITRNLALLLILPLTIYLASYGQMWLQGKPWSHFVELHRQIWAYQTTLTATHPYQSSAWQWFLNARPVWVAVEYGENTRADIYAFGNPALFFWGSIAVVLTALLLLKNKRKAPLPLVFVFISYLAVWTPWLSSPRVMFFYHYAPAVPLLAILLAYWALKLKRTNLTISVILCSVVLATIVWYPHWTLLPVTNTFADQVYFYFSSWK
ncbi:MAG: phospholipid carrier-dependent glycosyltransferase [bacterium]|nr:phospholipid carrier-dependent glycosyltransferase [bacterium]